MEATITLNNRDYTVDFDDPVDLSLPVKPQGVKAWYVQNPEFIPVEMPGFTGSVEKGGSVNFRDLAFNPHGHGTHTECVGHIAEKIYSVNEHVKQFMFAARLISIEPEQQGADRVITKEQLDFLSESDNIPPALIIRTLPNDESKKTTDYSSSNPPYIHHEAMELIVEAGVEHLLIDTPSVDREEDGGKLLSHRAFWKYPSNIRYNATITELIFVPKTAYDGIYLLNLQFAAIENDASPSKPVIYKLQVT